MTTITVKVTPTKENLIQRLSRVLIWILFITGIVSPWIGLVNNGTYSLALACFVILTREKGVL